jgi:hypothetical protein
MATTPRRLSRNTLARFLPDHESIVAFENLINEVAETLPATTVSVDELRDEFGTVRGAASEVSALRSEVARLRALVLLQDDRGATISKMQRQIDELRALVIGA